MELHKFESAEIAENGPQAEQSDLSFGFRRKACSGGVTSGDVASGDVLIIWLS